MPDYSNGKIYKLVSDKTDMIYIGSTTVKLNERLSNIKTILLKIMVLKHQKNYLN
jgi:hypothetical protein